MSHYHYSLRNTIWGVSVLALWSLSMAARVRMGDDDFASPADSAAAAARAKAKAFFETNFQIQSPAP